MPLIRRVVTRCCGQVFLIPLSPPTGQSVAQDERRFPHRAHLNLRPSWGSADRLYVYQATQFGGGGWCCATARSIRHSTDGSWGGGSRGGSGVLVVPDGVAKVVVRIGTTTIKVRVHDNIAAFNDGGGSDPFQDMIWYGPNGRVVHR